MSQKKVVAPRAMTKQDVKECAEAIEELSKAQFLLSQLIEHRNAAKILLCFKFDSAPGSACPPWRDTIQVDYINGMKPHIALTNWLMEHYEALVEDIKNNIREYGVDPDAKEE